MQRAPVAASPAVQNNVAQNNVVPMKPRPWRSPVLWSGLAAACRAAGGSWVCIAAICDTGCRKRSGEPARRWSADLRRSQRAVAWRRKPRATPGVPNWRGGSDADRESWKSTNPGEACWRVSGRRRCSAARVLRRAFRLLSPVGQVLVSDQVRRLAWECARRREDLQGDRVWRRVQKNRREPKCEWDKLAVDGRVAARGRLYLDRDSAGRQRRQ